MLQKHIMNIWYKQQIKIIKNEIKRQKEEMYKKGNVPRKAYTSKYVYDIIKNCKSTKDSETICGLKIVLSEKERYLTLKVF